MLGVAREVFKTSNFERKKIRFLKKKMWNFLVFVTPRAPIGSLKKVQAIRFSCLASYIAKGFIINGQFLVIN